MTTASYESTEGTVHIGVGDIFGIHDENVVEATTLAQVMRVDGEKIRNMLNDLHSRMPNAETYMYLPIKEGELSFQPTKLDLPSYTFFDGKAEINNNECVAYLDGKQLKLPTAQFSILKFLAHAPGNVFSRQQIAQNLWGYTETNQSRNIDVHVARIRQTAGKDIIGTRRGFGYFAPK